VEKRVILLINVEFARPELRPKYWKDPREKERNKHKVHKKGKDKDRRRQAGDRRRPSNKKKYESASSSSDSSDAPPKNTAKMAISRTARCRLN